MFRKILVIISFAVAAGLVGLLGLSPVAAQQQAPSAIRTFDNESPNVGDQVKVTIVAQGYGTTFGAIEETLPTGFEYDSLEMGGVLVGGSGQTVRFVLTTPNTVTFTYIVNVLDSAPVGIPSTFMGTLAGIGDISGTPSFPDSSVTVVAEPGVSGPSAIRTFDNESPNVGDQVKVTIVAQGYGTTFGAIEETLPTGFEYDSLEMGGVLVGGSGQTVRFVLTTPNTVTFTYIVNVLDSAPVGIPSTFMGTLAGIGDISGTPSFPDSSVTVVAEPGVSGPSAIRTFDNESPNVGDQVKVTIVAQGYGTTFGAIEETLPTGFEYDSLEMGGVLVGGSGQTVRFVLTTPNTVTFTYIVNVLDSAPVGIPSTFMGTLAGIGDISGTPSFPDSSVTVGGPSTPPARPAPRPAPPANNPPTFPMDPVIYTIAENSPPGTNVGEPVTATDLDGDTLTYTLGGADMADFRIDSASGQITVGPDTSLDFETKSMYDHLEVMASDGNGGNDTTSVIINLTDVDEAPPADSCVNDLGGFAPDRTETLTGTWTADCASENRLGRYANFFSFTLEEATEVTIELTSDEDTYLYLLEGMGRDGMALHENDDIVPATDTNSRIQETLAAGTYTIEATTYSVGQMGSFTLTVSGLGDVTTPTPPPGPMPTDDPCRQTLPGDDTVTGDWADDCESAVGDRGYARYYTFTLAEESEVTITLESDTDPYLYLREGEAKEGDFLHENDDIVLVTNTNSRIEETLAAGTYTIEATTYGFGETGSFTLTVSGLGDVTMPMPPQEPMPTDDPCRQTLSGAGASNGMWASDCDSTTKVGSYARYYTFTLAEESEVTITLESDTDPYLYLREGEAKAGDVLHENDDVAPGDTNSRIQVTLVAGTYTIEATTYSSGATGSFTLTVSGW